MPAPPPGLASRSRRDATQLSSTRPAQFVYRASQPPSTANTVPFT